MALSNEISAVSGAADASEVAAHRKIKLDRSSAKSAGTKSSIVLKKLLLPKGATIETLMAATSWQAHSVRGFLSAVINKKLGLHLNSEIGKDGIRRYRIVDATNSSAK